MIQKVEYMDMTAEIVSAYVANNNVDPADLPNLIREIHSALTQAGNVQAISGTELSPAVAIKKSVSADYIVCLEDGKRFKSLKRHLHTHYNLSPEEYRAKWGLPHDYPMVAPNYAKTRSALAREMGLGQKRTGSRRPRRGN